MADTDDRQQAARAAGDGAADGRATAVLGPSLHDIAAATGYQPQMNDPVGAAAPDAGGQVDLGALGTASDAQAGADGCRAAVAGESSAPGDGASPASSAPTADQTGAAHESAAAEGDAPDGVASEPAPAGAADPTPEHAGTAAPARGSEEAHAERGVPAPGAPEGAALLDSAAAGKPGEGAASTATEQDATDQPAPGAPAQEPPAPARPTLLQRAGWIALFCSIPVLFVALQLVGVLLSASLSGLALAAGARDAASYLLGSASFALLLGQVLCIAVAYPWWRYVARRHRAAEPRVRPTRSNLAGILVLGLGTQLVLSALLTVVLPLAPDLMQSYETAVNAGDLGDWALVPVLATALGAPVSEELFCRGLALTFAQKATGRFWAANVLQALMFGLLHGNPVQSAYTFLTALVIGLVFRRYGRVGPCVALHLALNASSYLMAALPLSLAGMGALGITLAGLGWLAADLPLPAPPRRLAPKR